MGVLETPRRPLSTVHICRFPDETLYGYWLNANQENYTCNKIPSILDISQQTEENPTACDSLFLSQKIRAYSCLLKSESV